MMQVLIILTWNGEGYSESGIEIVKIKNVNQSKYDLINHLKENHDDAIIEEFHNGLSYTDSNEDSGKATFIPLSQIEGIFGIELQPLINEYKFIKTQKEFNERYAELLNRMPADHEDDGVFDLDETCYILKTLNFI